MVDTRCQEKVDQSKSICEEDTDSDSSGCEVDMSCSRLACGVPSDGIPGINIYQRGPGIPSVFNVPVSQCLQ